MAERKNIFLIGRRGHEGDEDQLTEMLAFLWQQDQEALARWLESLDLRTDGSDIEVETQFTIPSGKRPDILIRAKGSLTLVESKLSSGFGETQIGDYLDFLGGEKGNRALVLLTHAAGLQLWQCKDVDLASQSENSNPSRPVLAASVDGRHNKSQTHDPRPPLPTAGGRGG